MSHGLDEKKNEKQYSEMCMNLNLNVCLVMPLAAENAWFVLKCEVGSSLRAKM